MKNIKSSFVIDEMIEKLTEIKSAQSERFVVEQLHTVRAYCDLLIKTYAEKVEPISKPTPKKSVAEMLEDEKLDSIFDF